MVTTLPLLSLTVLLSLLAGGVDLRTREHRVKKAKSTLRLPACGPPAPCEQPTSPAIVPVLLWVDDDEEGQVVQGRIE